jgi:hypothetical protein
VDDVATGGAFVPEAFWHVFFLLTKVFEVAASEERHLEERIE